jgi:hypothetical protein
MEAPAALPLLLNDDEGSDCRLEDKRTVDLEVVRAEWR